MPKTLLNCSSTSEINTACLATLDQLRPTQASLGHMLMQCKRTGFEGKTVDKMQKYIADHVVPGILGPGGNIYITDHHHFTAAMSGTKYSDLSVVACPLHDLRSTTEPDNFWAEMMNNGWVWMEDNRGQPLQSGPGGAPWYTTIPTTISASFADDPFRSFSEWVRDDYGYIKCMIGDKTASFPQCQLGSHVLPPPPYLEFKWADSFRSAEHEADPALVDRLYTMNATQQVQPLWGLVDAAIEFAQDKNQSSMPGFNQHPKSQKPKNKVSIDSQGCMQ